MQGGGSPCEESERSSHNNNGDSNWLPDGWTVEFKTRKSGYNKGKRYKCYVSAQGRKCYSKKQVFNYLKKIEAHVNTAKQGAEGVSAGESGSSVKETDAVELPWVIFCSAVGALYYRKIWEEDPEDEKLKKKLEVAEEDVHFMRESFPEDVPEDWKYNHETASNIVSRRDGDSGNELISIATALEEKINEKQNRKRNCCHKQSPQELRRFEAMLNRQWANFRKKLRVENLHFSTDEVDFTERFEAFGPVEEVQFPKDPETGHCEGLAHIEFVKLAHAKAAAQSLNGTEIAGQTIKVSSYADHLREQKQLVW